MVSNPITNADSHVLVTFSAEEKERYNSEEEKENYVSSGREEVTHKPILKKENSEHQQPCCNDQTNKKSIDLSPKSKLICKEEQVFIGKIGCLFQGVKGREVTPSRFTLQSPPCSLGHLYQRKRKLSSLFFQIYHYYIISFTPKGHCVISFLMVSQIFLFFLLPSLLHLFLVWTFSFLLLLLYDACFTSQFPLWKYYQHVFFPKNKKTPSTFTPHEFTIFEYRPFSRVLLETLIRGISIFTPEPDLSVEGILYRAMERSGVQDISVLTSSKTYMKLLEMNTKRIQEEPTMTSSGKLFLRAKFVELIILRLVLETLPEWIEINKSHNIQNNNNNNNDNCDNNKANIKPIHKPILITGLFRTGTTLLHHLLDLDPSNKTLHLPELLQPTPLTAYNPQEPFEKQQERWIDSQLETIVRDVVLSHELIPRMNNIHDRQIDDPEECFHLLELEFLSHLNLFITCNYFDEYFDIWINQVNMFDGYQWYYKILQYMKCDSRLVLKCPMHLPYLSSFVKVFGSGLIIQTHRDVETVLPSIYSLICTYQGFFKDLVDPIQTSANIRTLMAYYIKQNLEFRKMWDKLPSKTSTDTNTTTTATPSTTTSYSETTSSSTVQSPFKSNSPKQTQGFDIMDVYYQDLVKDPISIVKKIYQRMGYEYTLEFEEKMKEYLRKNNERREKKKHQYSSYLFGEDNQQILNEFEEYCNYFNLSK